MAAVFLLRLWSLTLLLQAATSLCGVTCYTDYSALLNCSCTSVPSQELRLQVNCSDGELHLVDSCQVRPPQSWCVMYTEELYDIAAIGTTCTTSVKRSGGAADDVTACQSSRWALSDAVKPGAPSNVRVLSAGEWYNITWDEGSTRMDTSLVYRLHIRANQGLPQLLERSFPVDEKFLLLERRELPLNVRLSVEVQAKMAPGSPSQGPWSEWSSRTEWTTTPLDAADENVLDTEKKRSWLYILLPVLILTAVFFLGLAHKPLLLKKLQLSTYVSKPHDFFKPLYLNHGGDFKEWVKPGFSEQDFLGSKSQVDTSTKQQWSCHQSPNEVESEGRLLSDVLAQKDTPLLPLADGDSAQSSGLSFGHVSIHTVTVSGEEDFDKDTSWSSLGSDDGSANYRELLGCHHVFQVDKLNGSLQDDRVDDALLREPERISLASDQKSEDSYPCVDLDTVDSGYGECGCPSDSNSGETPHFVHGQQTSPSNYRKQWMMCRTAGEDNLH
ncbi:interleukin 21 receptor, tandem duplicate 1 [Nerophis ophidion]|uniref:interleukin 21 receptor, tandem duplicate 1 n=1 Tax=Nerophis ophidion TaxID=159077 RepID=UPI002AE03196|nr:interleukin 21 receptor, tandem duplicate 1 [Nerophis ophidion]XP_061770960.1 interleukin 21 receptor, tandem duplicate 1 [Nerophis ophidion]XP_061770961.1 interleukin 21 receptor, tandem duplicate 1 [Nerophis ophidion]